MLIFLAFRGPLRAMPYSVESRGGIRPAQLRKALPAPLKVMLCAGVVRGIPSLTVGAPKGLGNVTFLAFRGPLRAMDTPL
jgi:hypothetical protein